VNCSAFRIEITYNKDICPEVAPMFSEELFLLRSYHDKRIKLKVLF
jgi:hypothetical protein